MTAFAGVRGTGNWGADERPKNFREGILWLNPNGTAPIFALTAKMGKKVTNDPEYSWWDEPNNLIRLQVKGALNKNATTCVVDSADPTSTTLGVNYGTGLNLVPGDLLMVEPSADVASLSTEIVKVTAVASATNFTISRGAAGTAAAAIDDNAFLLKIGSAFAEGTRSATAASRNPVKYENCTQIFKTSYEVTGTAGETFARTGNAIRNDKRRKMFDHSRDIETAMLFGNYDASSTGAGGKPERYMGGLRRYIPSSILKASWTVNDLLDAVSPVFDWDSESGDERMVFAGNGALNQFNKRLTDRGTKNIEINYTGDASMYGVNFSKYRVPQGTLMIKTHPLLSRHPLYTNSWWVLAGSELKWCPLQNRDTKFKDNIQHNDEDTVKGQWMTEAGIMVERGGLTCRYIGAFDK